MKNQPNSSKTDKAIVITVFCAIAAWYYYHLNPYSGFHDSLTYLVRANEGFHFLTHATAHFLYSNLLHLQTLLTGTSNQAYSHNLLSAAFAISTLLILYNLMLAMKINRFPALTGCVALALSYTFWSQSMTIEAYTMNNLLFISYTSLAIKDLIKQERKHTILVGFLLGLSLLTHIQNILSLPFYLYYIFTKTTSNAQASSGVSDRLYLLISLLLVLAAFFILFVPALFLNAYSPEVIFFDFRFREEVLANDPQTWLRGLLLGSMYAVYNFTILLPVIFFGMYKLYQTNKSLFLKWMLLLLPYLVFALRYDITDVYVYYLIPYIIASVFLAYGLNSFQWGKSGFLILMVAYMVFQPVFYKTVTSQAHKIEVLQQYGAPKAYKGGYSYYFWPGRRHAPDPLEHALLLYKNNDPKAICEEAEKWNVMRAWEYLYLKGKIEDPEIDC